MPTAMYDGPGATVAQRFALKLFLIVDDASADTDRLIDVFSKFGAVEIYDGRDKVSPDIIMTGRPLVDDLAGGTGALCPSIPVVVAVCGSASLSLRASLLLSRAVNQMLAPAIIVFPAQVDDAVKSTLASSLAFPPRSLCPHMLHVVSCAEGVDFTPEGIAAAAAPILTPAGARGKLIVIEGADGSGKQTQTARLLSHYHQQGRKAESVDFPHDSAFGGGLVRSLLAGSHGSLSDINPALFSSVYAINRLATSVALRWCLYSGVTVVCDRYATANFAHQGAKVADEGARIALIQQLCHWEFGVLGLPLPDVVVYLDLPPAVAAVAMAADVASGVRDGLDIHESAGSSYKEGVRKAFLWCSERFGWECVRCTTEDGSRVSRDDVLRMILSAVPQDS